MKYQLAKARLQQKEALLDVYYLETKQERFEILGKSNMGITGEDILKVEYDLKKARIKLEMAILEVQMLEGQLNLNTPYVPPV